MVYCRRWVGNHKATIKKIIDGNATIIDGISNVIDSNASIINCSTNIINESTNINIYTNENIIITTHPNISNLSKEYI